MNEIEVRVTSKDDTKPGFDSASKGADRMGQSFDKAGEAADTAEGRFQGLASSLTGTKDTAAGLATIARGNLFEGLVMTGQGAADLAEGLNYTVIPMAKLVAKTVAHTAASVAHRTATIASAVATKAMAAAQWVLNAAMSANPIGLVVIAIAALAAGFVFAWKKSEKFREVVTGVLERIKSVALGTVSAVVGFFKNNWKNLPLLLLGPIGLIILIFKALPGNVKKSIGNAAGALLDKGKDFIAGLIKGAADKIVDFGKFLGGLGKRAVIWVGTVTAKLYQKGIDFIDGLLDGAAEKVKDVGKFLGGLGARSIRWVGDVSGRLTQKGKDFLGGMLRGLGQKVLDVGDFFMRLPGRVLLWLGDTSVKLITKGAQFLGGMLVGLGRKIIDVSKFFIGIPGRVLTWIGDTSKTLVAKGGAVLQGFLDGLKSKWEGIKTWVGGIATWIKDHKGPVALDRQLLVPAGQAIMDGFLRGLKSGAGPTWAFVSKVGGKTVAQLRDMLGPTMADIKPGVDIISGNGYLNRVKYQGEELNLDTYRRLQRAEQMLGRRFRIAQGSFEGASSYSGTTHTGGGVVDVNGPGGWSAAVNALRRVGFAAWHRTPSQGPWGHHIHAVAIGDPTASASARDQVADYLRGGDGLAGMRHGGITGGRRYRVGEGGPEVLDLPAGAHVRPGAGYGPAGGGGPAVVELRSDGGAAAELVLALLRQAVQPKGGNVQLIVGGRPL